MTGMCGIDLLKHLQKEGIDLPVVMITGYGDIPTAVLAMRSGAQTFLEKPCNDQLLWESICLALEKQTGSRAQRAQRAQIHCRLATLTPEERAVLKKLTAGNPNKTIARELYLGLRTVELRRATILHKMQATSLAELVWMVTLVGECQEPAGDTREASEKPSTAEFAEPSLKPA
jgi:FixJ family two-component response regulator